MSLQITHSGIFSQGMNQWDADAADYLARVAIADGQALEDEVALAVNDLFVGLKNDPSRFPGRTSWIDLIALHVPMIARTFTGAQVPLKGGDLILQNFVPGDWSRKNGYQGLIAGSKLVQLAEPVTSFESGDNHISMVLTGGTVAADANAVLCGKWDDPVFGVFSSSPSPAVDNVRIASESSGVGLSIAHAWGDGFLGVSRANSTQIQRSYGDLEEVVSAVANSTFTSHVIGALGNASASDRFATARLGALTFGRGLDLTALRLRLNALRVAINSAIP